MDIEQLAGTPSAATSTWAAWVMVLWACSTWHLRSPLAAVLLRARAK